MLKPPLNPMLLYTREKPFNSRDYIFELKWDGYRCLAYIKQGKVTLQSRNKKYFTYKFPELKDISDLIKTNNAVLDGEICWLNKEGKPDFKKLQGRLSTIKPDKKESISLIVWDLLANNNEDVYHLPLLERKKKLAEIIKKESRLLIVTPYIDTDGEKMFKFAQDNQLEGIVAKEKNSPYEFKRSRFWYKIKIWQYTDVLIVGYSRNNTALLVGELDKDKLNILGKVKLALQENEKEALFRFLPSLHTEQLVSNKDFPDIIWVKPHLKCRIRYTELTRHNTFRHGYVVRILF
ncbi:non-homologous end-joining DNA ligase [Halocella sp. SP3-1]|uniref:non-homologous end-joining DNA ligase n=1 Tax=Halocella sp. SP3-1 TaxID=2382161 RepID=UPI000F75D623|nr:non-homologous end-joining DNA ligase [Halocella sp. SP3-1]AZO96098.1 hypothetical protein D7D81_16705 [Halocella sp. SP3-1]